MRAGRQGVPKRVEEFEIEELRARLEEAEQTLRAIREGEVDALVVNSPHGAQVFSLAGAERAYRLIVETMNEAALTVGPDDSILFCNQRFCELVKTPVTATIGGKLNAFVGPAQQQPLRQLLADAQGSPVKRRLTLRAADGAAVSVQIAASRLEVDAQASLCLVLSDLTELESHALSIRSLREQQEALEESRAELAEANRQLRDVARLKDEFLAMLSHELRNPLAPLRYATYLLASRGHEHSVVEQVQRVVDRQVTHLTQLVDDLLDRARLTRGRIDLRPERLDLARTVREVVADRVAQFEAASLTLEARTPEAPRWVRGDLTRLTQVVANLLDNAFKFTPAGGRVTVEVAESRETGHALVRVTDTGSGLDPELLERLFEPFAQGDRSLDRSMGGLGLGLPMVKGLVELHGGDVQAASAGSGRGAEFTVRLPLDEEPATVTPDVPPDVLQRTSRGLKVLVVEDNQDAAESLRMVLELLEHRVEVAFNGSTGLAATRRDHPDVVICDIGLPGMDGFAVARAVRSDPSLADIRLIAVTGYGSEDERRLALDAGFDAHLTKPVDPELLLRLLQAA